MSHTYRVIYRNGAHIDGSATHLEQAAHRLAGASDSPIWAIVNLDMLADEECFRAVLRVLEITHPYNAAESLLTQGD
jgi:hypothetical protein